MIPLTGVQARRLRLHAQYLSAQAESVSGAAQVVRSLVAVQAQEVPAAAWAIGLRSRTLTAAEVEFARLLERSFVRTWALRGTLHFVAVEDYAWLMALLGPEVVRLGERRYRQLGLSPAIRERALHVIRRVLIARGPQTRAELVEALAGQDIPTVGQAAYHLLHHAGLLGVICYGPDRNGVETYALVDDWIAVGLPLNEEAALAELTRRYLAGYGPVQAEDLASWSGLPLRLARRGFELISDEVLEIALDGERAWLLISQSAWIADTVKEVDTALTFRLLPAYDSYLLGYKTRALSVPEQHARQVHPGGGLLRPTLLLDGIAVGTWKLRAKKGSQIIEVTPFTPFSAQQTAALEEHATGLGHFLNTGVSLDVKPAA